MMKDLSAYIHEVRLSDLKHPVSAADEEFDVYIDEQDTWSKELDEFIAYLSRYEKKPVTMNLFHIVRGKPGETPAGSLRCIREDGTVQFNYQYGKTRVTGSFELTYNKAFEYRVKIFAIMNNSTIRNIMKQLKK